MPHRKSSRYEAAHRALVDRSGSLPQETSPEDLKIRTLGRATAFLHAQIQETQAYTEQLRQCLADRDSQPGEYHNYQREKWRADRRLAALKVLTESAQITQPMIPPNLRDERTSLPARKLANLSSFFQRGSRKAPVRFNCAVTGEALERRVLNQVSPLLLKPSIPPTWTQSLSVPNSLPPLYARRKQSEKMINTTSTRQGLWTPPSASYSTTEGTFTSDFSLKTLPDDDIGTTHEGIAVILSPTHGSTLRSDEEIIAEMGDITIPAYALNLLEDLDYIHDTISLRPESSPFNRPPFSEKSPSPLFITPSDWESPRQNPPGALPSRTTTIRIPDRHLADALLTSPEIDGSSRRPRRAHKVSLDPALFGDEPKSDKLGDVAPILRHSVQVPTEEEGRKQRGLLRKKSSGVFSMVSKSSDRRGETPTSTPRKNIASMVKKRMSAINRFR